MNKKQARKYAKGLLAAVPAGTDLDALAVEVLAAADGLYAAPEVKTALGSPFMPAERKAAFVRTALSEAGASPHTANFLALLAAHGHGRHLDAAARAVRVEVDAAARITPATVVSARPLSVAEQTTITAALGRAVGGAVRASYATDPSLIAGIVARAGDLVYDGSAVHQLAVMRQKLTGTTL